MTIPALLALVQFNTFEPFLNAHGTRKQGAGLCLRCFDLLSLDGVRITPLPLHQRKAMLAKPVAAVGDVHLQFWAEFSDPIKLLATCQRMNLEGIVSKRRELAYRSGPTRDWLKVKTATWRAENRGRSASRLFT